MKAKAAAPTLRAWLTRAVFWRMALGLGVMCALALAAMHGLLAHQQQRQLERRIAKLTDIALKAERDGAPLAQRLADYAPRRPGTRLVVRLQDGTPLYRDDPSLPAHALSAHVRHAVFTPAGLAAAEVPRFELAVDVSDDAELARSLGAMLLAITVLAAAGAGWAAAHAVRRGLAPIEQLTAALAATGPVSLTRRLSIAPPVAELQVWVDHFNALLERLERAYQQLESFNADVAHELRTPLNNLVGQTEVALSRPRSAAELQDTLSSNLEELHRLSHLVTDMLFLSRADRGAQARREPIASLAALAQDVAEFHDAPLQERDLQVAVAGDAPLCADANLLRRALSNLLSNAVRHARPGSTVRIEVDGGGDPAGRIVTLAVCNHGEDIAAEHLPRLFDRFFRADTSRHATEVNHGLGLSIVAAIARMHGGHPVAASAGGTTRIGLTLRAQPQE